VEEEGEGEWTQEAQRKQHQATSQHSAAENDKFGSMNEPSL